MRVDAALSASPAMPAPPSPPSTTTDQSLASNRLKYLFQKYPEIQACNIPPIFHAISKKRQSTYFIGKDMSFFTVRDQKVVPENRVRELFSEVDWVATMHWVEEQLTAKGLMPKNVDTSALDGMVAFPGERPAAEASADECKQSALNRMSQLIDKQNQRRALDIYKTQALNNFGPPKRPLEDSTVSGIDIQTKRQNMMELSRVGAPNELMMESGGNVPQSVAR
ncbi:hypothetical protein PHYSODRAFT_307113 [Phytophthora sojae]|uniref:Uncharacterized protein n=1 Tax=Phytophthora sojae (strain P6497) TaxID=1094619 RepID=G5ACR8_PHYSP|nr:hypothetical protein PHYSODRAFT_307113 [Phytophthora sojae]EGZ07142.1 hypothetical protein PHYSODRAFT_307113 [Phytophthora sojae]|eukprot:XP_009537906.1 hypothetical protein PHYSODRAFT_307113 [Phytophthora sojae]